MTDIPKNKNNPSKEIFAASGIYNDDIGPLNGNVYAPDLPNNFFPNEGTASTTTTPPDSNIEQLPNALFSSDLRGGNYFIDDMQVFNNYRHYVNGLQFNPQSFLEQSIVTFNIYNLDKRR
jgi:hypothetical protein